MKDQLFFLEALNTGSSCSLMKNRNETPHLQKDYEVKDQC